MEKSALHRKAYESMILKLLDLFPYELISDFLLTSKEDENTFSSKFGMMHKDLIGKVILLEFDPRRRYEKLISGFAKECTAHSEECIVFTRYGSKVYREILPLGIKIVKLTYVRRTGEDYALITDRVQILDVMNRLSGPLTSIIFDNLSDLIVSMGEREAYMFAVQALEILSKGHAPSLFLINGEAHDKKIIKAFEGAFNMVISNLRGKVERIGLFLL